MCTHCHAPLADRAAAERHARHDTSDGSPSCVDCHMPATVYGVLDAHPTHRITVPSPGRARALDMPDACTLCHVERSSDWAAGARARLWPSAGNGPPATDAPQRFSEVERSLFAGDPIQRALAAHAMGAPHRARGPRVRQQLALLLEVMVHDPYPAVRRFARNSASHLAALSATPARSWIDSFIPESTPSARLEWAERGRDTLADLPALDHAWIALQRAEAAEVAIDIGE